MNKPRRAGDPLEGHFAAGRISREQWLAGREFRRQYDLAHGADPPGSAVRWLAKAYEQIGEEGAVIVVAVLIHGLTYRELAASRGRSGSPWESYFSKCFLQHLTALSVVAGLAPSAEPISAVPPVKGSMISR
jgi:hypothetical protein